MAARSWGSLICLSDGETDWRMSLLVVISSLPVKVLVVSLAIRREEILDAPVAELARRTCVPLILSEEAVTESEMRVVPTVIEPAPVIVEMDWDLALKRAIPE